MRPTYAAISRALAWSRGLRKAEKVDLNLALAIILDRIGVQ